MILQVGVKLLIGDRRGRYLFLKRAADFEKGDQPWDIPGGRIDPAEKLEEALKREVLEETGLTVSGGIKLLAAQDIFVPYKDLRVVRLTYRGTASGEIKLSREHAGYKWMPPDEALKTNLDSYLAEIFESGQLDSG